MDPSQSYLAPFLAEHYGAVKARFPGEGRRKWRLRVAEMFWCLPTEQKTAYLTSISQNLPSPESAEDDAAFNTDDDPYDTISDLPGLGIILRTDFTNEDAWLVFSTRLAEAEAEIAAAAAVGDVDEPADEDMADALVAEGPSAAQSTAVVPMADAGDDTEMDEEEDGDEDAAAGAPPVFAVFDAAPAAVAERRDVAGISNLAALRLLNDVDVRRAPALPVGTKRIRPPNRLVDHDGWQEAYAGKTVWVYDERSNRDQCVRLVSQVGAGLYGTATGDSWRARVSHICELQVNLAAGAMSIDFGGMDRWDYAERARNMEDAVRPMT